MFWINYYTAAKKYLYLRNTGYQRRVALHFGHQFVNTLEKIH